MQKRLKSAVLFVLLTGMMASFLPISAKAQAVFPAIWQELLVANGAKTSFTTSDWQHFADSTTVLTLNVQKTDAKKIDIRPLLAFKNLRRVYFLASFDPSSRLVLQHEQSVLAQLTKLEVLELAATSVKTLKFTSKLVALRRLNIANTEIRSLQPLVGLRKLEIILCMETKINRGDVSKISPKLPKNCRVIRDYVE